MLIKQGLCKNFYRNYFSFLLNQTLFFFFVKKIKQERARERALQQYSDRRERAIRRFSNPEARKREKNKKLFKVFKKDNMEFIKEFEYQFEAIEYIKKEFNLNIFDSNISKVLKKKLKSTGGFVF